MPRTTETSSCTMDKNQEESSAHEESSSLDKEQDPKVFLQPSKAQVVPNMLMPYIEGPKIEWTVNDGLYHRFPKWHLKCKNILECELPMLPERMQCRKVIAWSGNFGMDQYVSWSMSNKELMPDTIWEKFEESNEVRARPRLLWLSTPQKLPRYFTEAFLVLS